MIELDDQFLVHFIFLAQLVAAAQGRNTTPATTQMHLPGRTVNPQQRTITVTAPNMTQRLTVPYTSE